MLTNFVKTVWKIRSYALHLCIYRASHHITHFILHHSPFPFSSHYIKYHIKLSSLLIYLSSLSFSCFTWNILFLLYLYLFSLLSSLLPWLVSIYSLLLYLSFLSFPLSYHILNSQFIYHIFILFLILILSILSVYILYLYYIFYPSILSFYLLYHFSFSHFIF